MLGQDYESVKLDMRQATLKSCALDGGGYCTKRGGGTLACKGTGWYCKQDLADIRQRERWGPRLREFKIGSAIRRKVRLGVN